MFIPPKFVILAIHGKYYTIENAISKDKHTIIIYKSPKNADDFKVGNVITVGSVANSSVDLIILTGSLVAAKT